MIEVFFDSPVVWICLFLLVGMIWGIVELISQITLGVTFFLLLCVAAVSGIISNKLYQTKRRILLFSLIGGVVCTLYFLFAFYSFERGCKLIQLIIQPVIVGGVSGIIFGKKWREVD